MTVDNDSSIPPNITFATEQKLSPLEFCTDDIVKIIKSLDPNKAHGHDEISIRMIKLCATSISKPLSILFINCFKNQCFPNEWKKANIVPVYKKNDKQLIKNYRPVSLLPVCSKIFEKVIFNSLFKYLEDNNLLNGNQSGFRPGDSCVHQLLSITHEIYKAFDANPSLEVRGVFLDLSKAFDKVWHDGLMYKLKRLGIFRYQYNAVLAITSTIRGTSKEKLYQELGLESLRNRRWLRRMSYLYKIISTKLPPYLYDLIPPLQRSNHYPGCFKTLRCRTELFRNSFLSFTVNEWNKLDSDIKNSDSYEMFRKKLLAFIRPVGNSMYGIYDPFGVKLINRLRLGFSHLREHKFRHNFADTVNPLCSCSLEAENTEHFFLRCQNNLSARTTLMNELNNISNAINSLNSTDLIRVILYGDKNFDNVTNFKIITET